MSAEKTPPPAWTLVLAVLLGMAIAFSILLPNWAGVFHSMGEEGAAWVQAIGSVAAILVAVAIARRQYTQELEQRKLASRPNIAIDRVVQMEEPRVQYYIRNDGLGPAVITSFDVLIDDKIFDHESDFYWQALFERLSLVDCQNSGGRSFADGHTLPAGRRRTFLRYQPKLKQNAPTNADLIAAFNRVDFVVSYRSIYNEELRWPS